MCFKSFKSISNKNIIIVSKFTKITNKKKKLESIVDINKLNDKLDYLSDKIDFIKTALLNNK